MPDSDKDYAGPYGYVGIHVGVVINMGNYQTARLEVSCTMPCKPDKRDDVIEDVQKFCEDRLKKEVVKLEAKKSGSK